MWGRWFPNDDEHKLPPPPTEEWLRRLAVNRRNFLRLGVGATGISLSACGLGAESTTPPTETPTRAATRGSARATEAMTGQSHEALADGTGDPMAPPVAAKPAKPEQKPAAKPAPEATATPLPGGAADRTGLPRTGGKLEAPIVVVIQLSGGNDSLNTVVPYSMNSYYQARPTLAVPADRVIKINDQIGFHPNLQKFKEMVWDTGQLALVQGVGYPNPNRSHFRSMDIYHTAEPVAFENYGWLGRYLDIAHKSSSNPFTAVNIGTGLPKALWARETAAAAIRDVNAFQLTSNGRYDADRIPLLNAFSQLATRRASSDPFFELVNKTWQATSEGAKLLQGAVGAYRSLITYPQGPFARSLQLIASLIQANLGTRVYYTSLGGFDDHASEKNPHERRLTELGDSIAAFYQDLKQMGLLDKVLIVAFSEFGRRVRENASAGTDHGAAQAVFVMGGKVKGGIYGKHPSLSDLDDGDLKYDTDFRAVYNMVLTDWLGVTGRDVLGQSFDGLGLLAR